MNDESINTSKGKTVLLNNISKHFGGIYALKGVNFDLTNEIHSIVGHNGAGKSTLVKILMGAEQPDEGTIFKNGKEVSFSSPREAQESGIAMVWQELANFPNLTITENLLMHRFKYDKFNKIDWKASHETAETYLKRININISPTMIMGKLTLAQQQLIEFAKALSYNPKILILDEPTSALSVTEQQIVYEKVNMIKSQNVSVVFISHKLDEILSLSDRITVLRDGRKIFTKNIRELDKQQIIDAIVGTDKKSNTNNILKPFQKISLKTRKEPVLKIKNLNLKRRLNDVSFNLYPGEVLGFSGVSGSGISDIGKILYGIEQEYSGTVIFNGNEYLPASPGRAVEAGFGYVPKNRKDEGIIPQMTVGDNIVLSALRNISICGFVNRKRRNEIINGVMDMIDLIPREPELRIDKLSGGNQQKGVIARWISKDSRVLIFDEPTRGVDVGAIAKIYSLIRQMAEKGLSVIVISSEFEEIHDIADRIVVLNRGRVAGEIDPCKQRWEDAFALAIK